jgi:predicted Rossmann-fold nucleotide-binding protein
MMVERYVQQQPAYPFLKAIENELITSQGILLLRYFPTPLMKRMLLSDQVQRNLKAIYFQSPSTSNDDFFSHEDRALLVDLSKFGIPVFWVDRITKKVLQYIQRPERDSGMFVPSDKTNLFLRATVFGVYGSNLLEGKFEQELQKLLQGVIDLKESVTHQRLNKRTPLALLTGGGPGAMEVGNRVAQALEILSCANIVDFRAKDGTTVNEQIQNPHVEAKMTYRLDKLVERQAEFHLDFPLFLSGGIGTDFELSLEEVRRKVGISAPNPILLFGSPQYWKSKISSRFQCNLKAGTIKGSEWISNCFFCIETAEEGIEIYRKFFEGSLPIGPAGPIFKDGFVIAKEC